jgi:hypothetical protein
MLIFFLTILKLSIVMLVFFSDNLKIKHCNVGSCNKVLGYSMCFVAWYTLPFFRELNLYLE